MEERPKYVFTANNWGKNLFDSKPSLRELLHKLEICDYEKMKNGRENGVVVPIQIRIGESKQIGQMSIYRSRTRGDRRFGISNIKDLGNLDDEMEIYYDEEEEVLICLILQKTMTIEHNLDNDNETVIQYEEYPIPSSNEDRIYTKSEDLTLTQETIGTLLNGTEIYVMPMFQRRYKWEKTEFDTLWSDIDDIWHGNENSQFLGAILVSISKPGAGSSTQENWVIDGQQRLTTLYALICAITKVAQDNGFGDIAENFADPLTVKTGTRKNTPTIVPTISDTKQFNEILKYLIPTLGQPKLNQDKGKNVRLINAWKNDLIKGVKARVRDSKGNVVRDKLEYLFEIIKDRLFFTMIILPNEINPYMIFERLNNTGKKLSAGDLVRNLIFENLIDMPEAANDLYEGSMREYEESFTFKSNNNVKSKLDDYYFPFTLTRPIENVTKGKMYVQLRHYWKTKKSTSAAMIAELKEMAPVYISLCREFPENEILEADGGKTDPIRTSEKIWKRLLRLRRYNPPTTTFPYLMELLQFYRRTQSQEDEVAKCLDVIESYLVRRNICSLQNAGFTNFFRGMWKTCGEKPDSNSLLRKLKSTSGYDYPDDESVTREIKSTNMYSKRALARYLLNEYEMSGSKAGHKDYVIEKYTESTIEHIIPETYTKWVPRMETWEFSDEIKILEGEEPDYQKWHQKYSNTIGNLTILQPYENSEASNFDWDSKFGMTEEPKNCKQYYYSNQAKYRRIKLTAEKYSLGYDNLSHDERSKLLTKWILSRWQDYE